MHKDNKISLKDLEGYGTITKMVNVIALCFLLVAVSVGGVGLLKMIIGLPYAHQFKFFIYFLISGVLIKFLPIMIIEYIINKFD